MTRLGALWTSLETDHSVHSGLLVTRLPSSAPCDVFAAIDKSAGTRVLMLEVNSKAIPAGVKLPQAAGFAVDVDLLEGGSQAKARLLLRSDQIQHHELFAAIADDVLRNIEETASAPEAIKVLIDRLWRWQEFFRTVGKSGMSQEAQRGLFAELFFVREQLLQRMSSAGVLEAWQGPLGRAQDFHFSHAAVEVKSSAAHASARILVSNARQLDPTGLPDLYLWVVQLDVRATPGESLPEIVDSIQRAFQDQVLVTSLQNRLLELGYVDSQRQLYQDLRYVVRREIAFHVTGDFPRIVEADLRPGVGSVRYSIDLSACLPYECSETALTSVLTQIGPNARR